MDLPFVTDILRPSERAALPLHDAGDAFLAGGTWLFSEPQQDLRRLVDLAAFAWPAVTHDAGMLAIAATCTLAELEAYPTPPDWTAAALIAPCCHALLGSFKIRHVATVGGNLCLALPAGPIAPLAVALDAACVVWTAGGGTRQIPALDFVTGPSRNALAPGDLLRELRIPRASLRRRTALRRVSLTAHGRSAALLIATLDRVAFTLTIAASTPTPRRFIFPPNPDPRDVARRIEAITDWYDDVHGASDWRAHMTARLADELASELAS